MKKMYLLLLVVVIQGCASMKSGQIKITGIAQNVKTGAIIQTEDGIYHIDGLDYWDELAGKRIRVKGTLHVVRREPAKISEKGLIEQGFSEVVIQKIIKNAKWKAY